MSGQRETVWKELDRLSLLYSDELNSVKFYDKLDYIKNFSKYNEKCKSLTSLPNGERIQKTCARLLTYLETDSFSTNNDNQYDYCLLLNYWVLNNLNIFLYLKNSSQIVPAFGKIEFIWNSFIDDNLQNRRNETCKPIHSIIMDNDWRDRKELYEYYVDYSPIIETVKNYSYTCKEYYHYVESKKKLYEHFKEPCLSKDTNMCPKFYDECKKYDPENVLSNHSCHEYIMKERAAAAPSVLQRVNETVV
ncbi:Plasmodium vivax Vir protein, putative [Plasmodium vivax]|uniref:Vir protein, putative n=1 Tax=Plasmodium vivax TaxID=5855 RepID=A0A1G4E749_PLAVI|nr:Plasmodium vivax Vir protein, putative [Plasmodium vivax]